jgi:hypothetical protein
MNNGWQDVIERTILIGLFLQVNSMERIGKGEIVPRELEPLFEFTNPGLDAFAPTVISPLNHFADKN